MGRQKIIPGFYFDSFPEKETPFILGVDSNSMLFNHPSFQNPGFQEWGSTSPRFIPTTNPRPPCLPSPQSPPLPPKPPAPSRAPRGDLRSAEHRGQRQRPAGDHPRAGGAAGGLLEPKAASGKSGQRGIGGGAWSFWVPLKKKNIYVIYIYIHVYIYIYGFP